jgi:hypothetical protein
VFRDDSAPWTPPARTQHCGRQVTGLGHVLRSKPHVKSLLLSTAAVLVLRSALPFIAPAGAAHRVVGRGHITLTGAWTSTRSLTVLLDSDSIDGFFLAAPKPGTAIGTKTIDHGGRGYNLSINFHRGQPAGGAPRQWISGCSTSGAEERNCIVPDGAGTLEITGTQGMDLDVTVFMEHRRARMSS